MSTSRFDENRRTLLKLTLSSAAAVPLGSLLIQRGATADELTQLSEQDRAARALGYVHDASRATGGKREEGQFCKNCNLIQTAEGEWRPCSIFRGKSVHENGWCVAWVGRT